MIVVSRGQKTFALDDLYDAPLVTVDGISKTNHTVTADRIVFDEFVDEYSVVEVRHGGGGGGGGDPGAKYLYELLDVNVLGTEFPQHGETLTYDVDQEKWIPVRITTGYDFGLYLVDPPEHMQKVFRVALNRDSRLPQNMEGSRFVCDIPPQEVARFKVYKNTNLIGHITFPAGSFTGQVTDLLETEFVAGDIITLQTDFLPQYEGFSGIGIVIRMRLL